MVLLMDRIISICEYCYMQRKHVVLSNGKMFLIPSSGFKVATRHCYLYAMV